MVVTEVRSESFGLVLHAQHIFATQQVYLYNGLLCLMLGFSEFPTSLFSPVGVY